MRKVANYRIGVRSIGENASLQEAVDRCQDNYPERGFPVFEFRYGESCLVARHSEIGGGRTFIHLVVYEEGAGAAVIRTVQQALVDEAEPPNQNEFIRLQVFLLCSDSHGIWTAHNSVARDRTVQTAINKLIETFAGYQQPPGFMLEARLNEQHFQELMAQGIEEIDLKAGGFRETMEYLSARGRIRGGGAISMLQSFAPEADDNASDAADDVVLRMKIKPRPRKWAEPGVASLLCEIAQNVWVSDDDEHGDGFSIVTKSGLTLTQDEMRVRDYMDIDGNRRVLDVDQVATRLNHAFGQFAAMGVLT